MKRIVSAFCASLAIVSVLLVGSVQAVSPQQSACEGAGGIWRGGSCDNPESTGGGLLEIITNIINTLLVFSGVVAVIMIIIGGFRYIMANGDASKITGAKNTLMYAIIGLIVVIASFAIVNFVLDRF